MTMPILPTTLPMTTGNAVPSLLDIQPCTPRDPFAPGALLPMSVETKNSLYTLTMHALLVDKAPTCTVTCERGTFAGQSWNVRCDDVILHRLGFAVAGIGLRTTAPTHVNGEPITTWPEFTLGL